jgi:hypothetical protein
LSAGCLALCGTAVLRGWRDTGMWHLQPRGHETTLDKRYQQRFEVDIAQRPKRLGSLELTGLFSRRGRNVRRNLSIEFPIFFAAQIDQFLSNLVGASRAMPSAMSRA